MNIQIFVIVVLILLNAFFAASEIALISINESKVKAMAKAGHKKAKLLKKLLKDPGKFLATIQIGITLAGFLASAFAAESFADRLVKFMQEAQIPISQSLLKAVSVTGITIILSYFTLVLGELVPKRLAMQKPEPIAMFAVGPLRLLSYITGPFVKFLTLSTNFFIKILGGNPHADEDIVTEEEILLMIDEGQEKGTIQQSEKEMINNIFDFNDKVAEEIMTHRIDVLGVPCDMNLDEAIEFIHDKRFSRFPIYRDSIDNIIGILHVKDLVRLVNSTKEKGTTLTQIIRKPYFVPQSKKIDALLKELQKHKTHMAVVIDEYGGTAGIVTIEDVLEELVGNIFDEYDEEILEFDKVDQHTYMFEGTIHIEKVEKIMNIKLFTEEYDTLSGYIIGRLGRIPSETEKPIVKVGNTVFEVLGIEEKRITKVKAYIEG